MTYWIVIWSFFLFTSVREVSGASASLSPSSIAGISFVLGFVVIVLALAGICRCYRKHKLKDIKDRNQKLKSIGDLLREHVSENPSADIDSDLVEQTITDNMVVQHAHVQKYTDWRSNQVNPQIHVKQPQTYTQQQTYYQQNKNQQQYVHQQPYQQRFVPMTFDRQVVMRQSNRSLSPVQTQKERGRSTTRQFMYAQQPNASLRIQKVDAPLRSKSAPPINRGTIQRVVQREPIVYTTSHFMAIRKPGSKKYLLPPTKVYTEARETNRTVVVERRVPQPRQPQKVIQGNVYHVQYNPETANIVRNRGYTISGEQHRMVSAPVSAPTTPRYYQQPQEFVFSRRATDVRQPIKLASYTPKIIQGTQLTTENRTHTWSASNGGVANGRTVWSSDDMHVTPGHLTYEQYAHSTASLPAALHSDQRSHTSEPLVYHVEYAGTKRPMTIHSSVDDLDINFERRFPPDQPVYIRNDYIGNNVISGARNNHIHGAHKTSHSGKVLHVWSTETGWTDESVEWSPEEVLLRTRHHVDVKPLTSDVTKTHIWKPAKESEEEFTIVDFVDNGSSHASWHANKDDHHHAINDLDNVLKKSKSSKSPSSSTSSSSSSRSSNSDK